MDASAIIARWVASVNQGDLAAFGKNYASDATLYVPVAQDGIQGREAIAQYEGILFAAFSEVALEVSPALTGTDRVAVEWTYKAKHTAPLVLPDQTVAPTNRSLSLEGGSFMRINERGEIAEERRLYNPNSLFEQLGIGQ